MTSGRRENSDDRYTPVTLGSLVGKITMLEVACRKCERRGRLSLVKLIERHGADMQMPNFRSVVAADCPRMQNPHASIYDLCGVCFPQLPTLG